ncbi:hypothetical protein [Amycolatopsis thermoflava]|uniref:hypothetical protein n=1 Tax=Amycolatopsis thermoflava TaxID=84480 RepID=UPI00364E76A9
MREDEVRAGETYVVHIPRRDNPIKYVTGDPARGAADVGLAQLSITRTNDFELTITMVGELLGEESAVSGIRVTDSAHLCLPVPPEVAERIGLSPGLPYFVDGVLRDATTEQVVNLPIEQRLTVPVRWLRPTDAAAGRQRRA